MGLTRLAPVAHCHPVGVGRESFQRVATSHIVARSGIVTRAIQTRGTLNVARSYPMCRSWATVSMPWTPAMRVTAPHVIIGLKVEGGKHSALSHQQVHHTTVRPDCKLKFYAMCPEIPYPVEGTVITITE